MTETELAWFAGVFEGEGNFDLRPKRSIARLRINMTDKDVLERVKNIIGGNVTGPYYRDSTRKPYWCWSFGKQREVKVLTKQLLPYLGNRRWNRAIEVLRDLKRRENAAV